MNERRETGAFEAREPLRVADPLPYGVPCEKYRKMLLERRVQEVLKETSVGIAERYEIEMEALGMDGDHVHLLCGAHPKEATRANRSEI